MVLALGLGLVEVSLSANEFMSKLSQSHCPTMVAAVCFSVSLSYFVFLVFAWAAALSGCSAWVYVRVGQGQALVSLVRLLQMNTLKFPRIVAPLSSVHRGDCVLKNLAEYNRHSSSVMFLEDQEVIQF